MRFLIAFIVLIALSMNVSGQALTSSGAPAVPTSSGAPAVPTSSGPAPSLSSSPSATYPQPPAPVGLVNRCVGHKVNICPEWSDPAGFSFNLYRLYYKVQLSTTEVRVTTASTSTRIFPLPAGTLFDFWVAGVDVGNGVWSANSTAVTMQTIQADPKLDPSRDIQSFTCSSVTDTGVGSQHVGRKAVSCSWTAALDTVRQINYKVHCTSADFEPLTIKKRRYGTTAANAVSAYFHVHRDAGTCVVHVRFYYATRPSARKVVSVTL